MGLMSFSQGVAPSPWALLVFAIPLLKPILFKLMDLTGHDDLQILFGVLLAVVLGGGGFHLVGLSSELGALVFGALLSSHARAGELSKTLWGLKEFFLVGFFLNIGLGGLPDQQAWLFAALMTLLVAMSLVAKPNAPNCAMPPSNTTSSPPPARLPSLPPNN